MPRLALVFEYPTLHGGEHSLLACLPWVREAGFEIAALAPESGPLAAALTEYGVEVHAIEAAKYAAGESSQAQRRERLAAAIQRLRPDLVHANSLSMSRLAGPVAAELGVVSIGHLRDIVSLSRRAVADINRHNRLLAVSQATRDWHIAQGISPERVYVCYNGVDLSHFQPRTHTGFLHRELGLPATAPLIGSIGQLVMRKGLDVAMESMRLLVPDFPDVHWVIVGERFSQKDEAVEYERRLRDAAAAPPLAGRVHFLGVRDDVNRILNELMLLLHAARQEPLGRVLLEAAASGVPIVATDVGGTTEILPRDEFRELLAPADDPVALAAAARRLLRDSELRKRLSPPLQRRAAEAFDAAAAAARLVQHYEAVLAPKLS
jgi:glycosyltransferase involved in cell wall biosynthesis